MATAALLDLNEALADIDMLLVNVGENCGIGSEGFEEGNTCAKGAGGKAKSAPVNGERWAKSLTALERTAVREYATKGFGPLNQVARGQKSPTKQESQFVSALDSAIDKSPPLKKSLTVYRVVQLATPASVKMYDEPGLPSYVMASAGQERKEASLNRSLSKKGAKFTDAGFTSTSMSAAAVEKMIGEIKQRYGGPEVVDIVRFKVNVPKGAKAAVLGTLGYGKSAASEAEVLLPRNSKFTVVSSKRSKGYLDVEVNLTPLSKRRPTHNDLNEALANIATNAFCATGKGGGVDPSCRTFYHGTSIRNLKSIRKYGINTKRERAAYLGVVLPVGSDDSLLAGAVLEEATRDADALLVKGGSTSLIQSFARSHSDDLEKRVKRTDKKIEAARGRPTTNENPQGCNQYTGPGCSSESSTSRGSSAETVAKAKGGDREAMGRVVQENQGIVHKEVHRYTDQRNPDYDDLVQEGNLGLMRATKGFDPSKGASFGTYAWQWVRSKIGKAAKARGKLSKREATGKEDLEPKPEIPQKGPPSSADLEKAMGKLDERSRSIVAKRFGLGGQPTLTQEEVGGHYHITKMRVSQLESRALKHLRESLGVTMNQLARTLTLAVVEGNTATLNAFCATGKGGGIDPSCSLGGKGGGGKASSPQTQTKEFKTWFKGSKVVDEKGEPQVVYHGTGISSTIQQFAVGRETSPGAYFTSDPNEASRFASYVIRRGEKPSSTIYPVFLSIRNPRVLDFQGRVFDMGETLRLLEQAKSEGQDGAILKNVRNFRQAALSDTYIVFSATQIKSAIGNRGTFDPKDPIITHARHQLDEALTDLDVALVENVFCATGKGGGVDATCSPGEGGGSGGKGFDRKEWEAKDVGKRRDEWAKLPVTERDRLADAGNSVPARMKDHLADAERPSTGNLRKDLSARVAQHHDRLHSDAAKRIDRVTQDYHSILEAAGVSPSLRRELGMAAADVLVSQEVEGMGRQLGDHGIAHVAGNIKMATDTLKVVPGQDTPRDIAVLTTATIFHDAGYLTPPSQMLMDEGHPRWSAEHYDANVRPMVEKALGKRAASEVEHIIRTHDSTDVDWGNDPIASAARVADNTSLFRSEKLPPIFRYVPANVDVLKDLASKKVSPKDCGKDCQGQVKDAQTQIHANIDRARLPEKVKARLHTGVDEVGPITPKMTLGMLGGEVTGVKWNGEGVDVHLRENKQVTELNTLGDFGQRQFGKFAESYGADPDQFKKDLNFTFKNRKGQKVLRGIYEKMAANARAMLEEALCDIAANAFCATGKGGGVDPSCSPEESGKSGTPSKMSMPEGSFAEPSQASVSEPGYHYHATTIDRAEDIVADGRLKTRRASYGTDQGAWPDRSTEKRAYFIPNAGAAWQFAPEEGKPVLLRVHESKAKFRKESTGDTYVQKSIPVRHVEIQKADGSWVSLATKPKQE